MNESSSLKTETYDGVRRILLARPKYNVLDIEMMQSLTAELELLETDTSLKAVVIEGEGSNFCAGVEVADHKPEKVDDMITTFNRIFEYIHALDIPVIAAVRGACLGGGMEVAIACDIVVAAENSIFGQPEIKLGFFPPYAAVRLPALVGPARAVEICTTGKRYTATEALQMGLVSYCVPNDDLEAAVEQLLNQIRECSPLIIRLNKQAIQGNLGKPVAEGLASAGELFLGTLMKTEDTLEGIRSFEEKRKPVWQNR